MMRYTALAIGVAVCGVVYALPLLAQGIFAQYIFAQHVVAQKLPAQRNRALQPNTQQPRSLSSRLSKPLGMVINKFCNGMDAHSAKGDTIELLVLQRAFDARGMVLKDYSPKTGIEDFDNGGGFIFREDAALWKNLPGGMFIVLAWTDEAAFRSGDTLIRAGLLDTTLFQSINTRKNSLFNIAERDAIMLKRKGSPFEGSKGCIHAFSAGLTEQQLNLLKRDSVAILFSANRLTKDTPNVYVLNTKCDLSDYLPPEGKAESALRLPQGRFGEVHSEGNRCLVDGVRR